MANRQISALRLTVLTASLVLSLRPAEAELWFPPELISESKEIADLSRFSRGQQLPGHYTVSLYLNQHLLGVRKMAFVPADTDGKRAGVTDNTGLMAVLTRSDLIAAGVRQEAFSDSPLTQKNAAEPLSPGSVIPHATTHFDFQKMRLDISIPQRWVQRRPRNWTPSERWDEGITAGLLNWSFSGNNTFGRNDSGGNDYYLRLHSGVNIGPWRLRDERTLSVNDDRRDWSHERLWLERSISDWRSRLKMGDIVTRGEIFDSSSIRGVNLMTDDDMYPDTERGYAPVVRGTALSNARISVRQNGYVVYETNVAPGEFVIDDIDQVYSSGDLEVTVTEADGGRRIYTVPYATVPNLLREGRTKYALNAGQLQNYGEHASRPLVLHGTLMRGMPHGITLYGGLQYTRKYQAAALGAGINMQAWGAFSADVTHADSILADENRHRGQSVRFLYSRGFETTGTTFQLAGYRYSTRGFYTLEESQRSVMQGWQYEQRRDAAGRLIPRPLTDWYDLNDNRRERMEVNINQRMTGNASLYLTGSRQTYWHTRGASTSLQAGVSASAGGIGYSLSYNESYSPSLKSTDRAINVSLSVPLNRFLAGNSNSIYASVSAGHNSRGELAQQTTLSGSALERNNLNWSVNQTHSRRSGGRAGLRLNYRGTYGETAFGYSHGRDYQQISYDASGGLILHRNGLTAGQSLSSAAVLVEVPGGPDIPVIGGSGVRTDWRGFAIQPWASEFRENRVALDVAHLDPRTEVKDPVVRVVPTRGAVVRARFVAKTGHQMLMTLKKDGKPLPFGTVVSLDNSSSIVGEDGQVYLSGLADNGTLTAKWGNGDGQSCRAAWHISGSDDTASVLRTSAVCR
ncbi:fimbria/pilus outer membrane usher protein [Erwinia sp. HDF1-3R]|uniref:fimbria/pilus outer membrane usher protein n=1 Tax=Erwinia sp. HDF1-3R TaxID=3141543 RepID=UPI0031F4B9BB